MVATRTQQVRSLLKPQSKSFLPLFVFASLCLNAAILVSILGLAVGTFSLAGKPPVRVVEKPSGKTVEVELMDSASPSAEAVQQYVAETVYELYDWRAILPPKNPEDVGAPKPDPGVDIPVGNSKLKVTRSTWRAGFKLDESFRREFLQDLARITPQDIFTGRGSQASILPRDISPPEKLPDGRWKVTYQGILMFFNDGDNLGKGIPRRHEIYVREIDHYRIEEKQPKKELSDQEFEGLSDLQRMMYATQESGLLIEAMPEITDVQG